MSKVYITGHRNPDLDSLCAATAYARLKNLIDPNNEYIPIRCSHVSDSVRKQMEVMEIEIPVYKKDVRPKIRDVMMKPEQRIQADAPIFDLIKAHGPGKPSVVPIFNGEKFKGLLSVDNVTSWFLPDNPEETPTYKFIIDNILKVIPSELFKRGEADVVEGQILVGAASFDAFCKCIDENPNVIVVMGARAEHIEYAALKQVPAIIITADCEVPDIDLSDYKGSVIVTPLGTAETIRRVRMAEAVELMMDEETQTINADDLFADVKKIFLNSFTRGLAVMDGGEFTGFVTRRCFLSVPAHNVIMVDHNEPAQSVEGIETANIVEIIDHHRLDALSTKMPIFIDAEPLGSTCTIVYQQYIRNGIMPEAYIAKVLLTGIISDTLILRSPTTTVSDLSTVEMLARIARIPSIEEFGEKLFSITDNLAIQDPEASILSDFKKYESGGVHMGIGQCEVTTLANVSDYADRYIETLEKVRDKQGLDWTLLMITDVLREKSVLLVSDFSGNRDLPYAVKGKQMYDMPGVMSRKKQLLPTLISVTAK